MWTHNRPRPFACIAPQLTASCADTWFCSASSNALSSASPPSWRARHLPPPCDDISSFDPEKIFAFAEPDVQEKPFFGITPHNSSNNNNRNKRTSASPSSSSQPTEKRPTKRRKQPVIPSSVPWDDVELRRLKEVWKMIDQKRFLFGDEKRRGKGRGKLNQCERIIVGCYVPDRDVAQVEERLLSDRKAFPYAPQQEVTKKEKNAEKRDEKEGKEKEEMKGKPARTGRKPKKEEKTEEVQQRGGRGGRGGRGKGKRKEEEEEEEEEEEKEDEQEQEQEQEEEEEEEEEREEEQEERQQREEEHNKSKDNDDKEDKYAQHVQPQVMDSYRRLVLARLDSLFAPSS